MDIHDYAESKRLSLRRILDFTSSVNPLGTSSKARNAIRKAIKYLEFPPDEKIRHLKRYICKHEQIEENHIVFGQGSSSILHSLLKATKPKTILLASPVSERYKKIVENYNIAVQSFPADEENGFSIDIGEFVEHLEKADMVILPNPHDMTGISTPIESLGNLITAAEKSGKILVIDERYMDFATNQSPVKLVAESQNALILRTFSVFHALEGLPLGYGTGSPVLIKKLTDNLIPPQGNALTYAAAITSLKDKERKARTVKLINEEKKYFMEKLRQTAGLRIFDTECNFLLVKIERQISDLENLFLKYHIIIDGYSSESTGTYLKVPLKRHKLNARFIKTLKYILKT